MKFIFAKDEEQITAEMPEAAGYDYARKHGYKVISAIVDEEVPLTREELEEIALDHEYRLMLLEMGVSEE